MLKVGIIGCGVWGRQVARNFAENPRTHVRYFCDLDKEKLLSLKSQYGYVNITTDLLEVLDDHDVDAVAVCCDNIAHFQVAGAALAAGKHVLIEPPLSLNRSEAEAVTKLAAEKNRTLMVNYVYHYHAVARLIREVVHSGELGEIRYAYATRVNLGRVRPEERNVIWTFGHQDIYLLELLLGRRPSWIHGRGCSASKNGVTDTVVLFLNFGGVPVHLHVSNLPLMKKREVVIVGSRKMLVFDDVSLDAKLKLFEIEDEKAFSSASNSFEYAEWRQVLSAGKQVIPRIVAGEPLAAAVDHFARSVIEKTPPLTDGRVGSRMVYYCEKTDEALVAQADTVALEPDDVSA